MGLRQAHHSTPLHEAGHANLSLHVACQDGFEIQDCPDCEDTRRAARDEGDRGMIALDASLLELWGRDCEDMEDPVCRYIEDTWGVMAQLIAPEEWMVRSGAPLPSGEVAKPMRQRCLYRVVV